MKGEGCSLWKIEGQLNIGGKNCNGFLVKAKWV